MPKAFVVRTIPGDGQEPGAREVFKALKSGKARIGWSEDDDQDLRKVVSLAQKDWSTLTAVQKDAWRCHGFLDRATNGDLFFYPHQPRYGKFCIAQISPSNGDYGYDPPSETLDGDFRSFRPCTLLTPEGIDVQDAIVPPRIRKRLGLQGRFWELYDFDLVTRLMADIPSAGKFEPSRIEPRVARIFGNLTAALPSSIHREFPRHDFSWFCKELFERMGYSSVIYQEGPHERGSDIVVSVGNALLPEEINVGVQAFSYADDVSVESLQEKLDQLLAGWDANHLDYGVLITTGMCSTACYELIKHHSHDNPKQLIKLIAGVEIARLFLEHFDVPSELQVPGERHAVA
jgi:hypothetical protein